MLFLSEQSAHPHGTRQCYCTGQAGCPQHGTSDMVPPTRLGTRSTMLVDWAGQAWTGTRQRGWPD